MEYLIAGRSSLDSRGHIRLLLDPWMDGVIAVQGKAQNIPNYPVYASGARINNLPVYNFTPDEKLETGLSWDPHVLLTGKEISFFVTFFDRANNKPNLLPYDFVIIQGGKQLSACSKYYSSWNERSTLRIFKFGSYNHQN